MPDIETLRKKVNSCTNCPLHKTRKNAVFGEGPHNAKIMIIGEAPGANEDDQGEPFVGMAGRELTKMLEEVGVNRDSVFITNTVKCRPPENRNPKKDEVASCSKYLDSQIESINPSLICTLGNVSLKRMVGNMTIGEAHGKEIEKNGRLYLPLYHPAAWMYNRKIRDVAKKDYEKLKNY